MCVDTHQISGYAIDAHQTAISNYYQFNLSPTSYMGCVSTKETNNNNQKRVQQNIPPSAQIPPQTSLTTDYNQHNPKHNQLNASIIDVDVHVNVPTETNQHPIQPNRSPRPQWNVKQIEPHTTNHIDQSEVKVLYSSDAKEHLAGHKAPSHSNYFQSNIAPIAEVPSALEVDSKKYSLPANSNEIPTKDSLQTHKKNNQQAIDIAIKQEQRVKEEKMVELENIPEILSSGRSPYSVPSRTHRVHAQEHIFINYEQNFELPFCFVALTAET